jgi:hypothetical protein
VFDFFVPWFDVHSLDELIRIREDPLFAKVRAFSFEHSDEDVTEELLIDELYRLEKAHREIQHFNRVVSWVTPALSEIPLVGGLIQKAVEQVTERTKTDSVIGSLGWVGFFANYREKLTRDRIAHEYRAKKGGAYDETLKLAHRMWELTKLEAQTERAKMEVSHFARRLSSYKDQTEH